MQNKLIAYYKPGNFSYADKEISLSTAVNLFKSERTKSNTLKIRAQFKKELEVDFEGYDKKPYQAVKKRYLAGVIFGGTLDRATGEGDYSGLITIDLDNNEEENLLNFFKNTPKSCFAHGWSVSGAPNGWVVFNTPVKNKEEYDHYANALKAYLEVEFDLKTSKSDPIRLRYISYDKDLFVNWEPELYGPEECAEHLGLVRERQREQARLVDEIEEEHWVDFCTQYALKNGYTNKAGIGHRHMFATYFAICANLLGVKKDNCEAYLRSVHPDYKYRDAIEYPYRTYKESHNRWGWRIQRNVSNTYTLGAGQFVSDLGVDFTNKILFAGTGTGKTYAAASLHEKTVITVPYYSLCENIASEYEHLGFKAYNALSKVDGKPNKIVTTFASLSSLTRHLGDSTKDYNLIVDEAHNLTLSASRGFMLDDLNFIAHCLEEKKFKTTTLLSGTWLYNIHPIIREMEIVKVVKNREPKLLTYVRAEHTLQTVLDLVKESIGEGEFPFVLQNDTSVKRDTLIGGLDGMKIKFFTSRSKQDKDFLSIAKDSTIKKGVNGIVTTTVLKEGNNINNEFDFHLIVVGNYHSSEIEQVSQRFRKAKSIKISIVKPRDGVTSSEWGDARQFTWDAYQTALEELKMLRPMSRMEEKFRKMFDIFPFRYDGEEAVLDYLLISHMGLQVESILENRNAELQTRNLSQYNIKISGEEVVKTGNLKVTEVMEDLKERSKQEKEDNYKSRIATLAISPKPLAIAKKVERFESHKLEKGEDLAVKYLIRISRYHSPKVVLKYMAEIEPIENRLRKLERYFLFNAAYHISLSEGTREKVFLENLINVLPTCETLPDIAYTIVEIGEKVGIGTSVIRKEILKWEGGGKSLRHCFSSTRALLESMFVIKTQRVRGEDKRIIKYSLSERKRIGFPHEVNFQATMNDFFTTI